MTTSSPSPPQAIVGSTAVEQKPTARCAEALWELLPMQGPSSIETHYFEDDGGQTVNGTNVRTQAENSVGHRFCPAQVAKQTKDG